MGLYRRIAPFFYRPGGICPPQYPVGDKGYGIFDHSGIEPGTAALESAKQAIVATINILKIHDLHTNATSAHADGQDAGTGCSTIQTGTRKRNTPYWNGTWREMVNTTQAVSGSRQPVTHDNVTENPSGSDVILRHTVDVASTL
jgi:hypothetical protein